VLLGSVQLETLVVMVVLVQVLLLLVVAVEVAVVVVEEEVVVVVVVVQVVVVEKNSYTCNMATDSDLVSSLCRGEVIAQLQNTLVAVVKYSSVPSSTLNSAGTSSVVTVSVSMARWSADLTDILLNPLNYDNDGQTPLTTSISTSSNLAPSTDTIGLCLKTLRETVQTIPSTFTSTFPLPSFAFQKKLEELFGQSFLSSLASTVISGASAAYSLSGAEGLVVIHVLEENDKETLATLTRAIHSSRSELTSYVSPNCETHWWTHQSGYRSSDGTVSIEVAHTSLAKDSLSVSLFPRVIDEQEEASKGVPPDKFWLSFSWLIDSAQCSSDARAVLKALVQEEEP